MLLQARTIQSRAQRRGSRAEPTRVQGAAALLHPFSLLSPGTQLSTLVFLLYESGSAWLVQPVRFRLLFISLWLASGSLVVAQEAAEREIEDVTVLPSMQVKGVRMEDLGVRFNVTIRIPGADTVTVAEVFPNTAALKDRPW